MTGHFPDSSGEVLSPRPSHSRECRRSVIGRRAALLWLVGGAGWVAIVLCPPFNTLISVGKPMPGIRIDWWHHSCLIRLRTLPSQPAGDRPLGKALAVYLKERCPVTGARYLWFRRPIRLWGVDQVIAACRGWHPRIEWRYPWRRPRVVFFRIVWSKDLAQDRYIRRDALITRGPGVGCVYIIGPPKEDPHDRPGCTRRALFGERYGARSGTLRPTEQPWTTCALRGHGPRPSWRSLAARAQENRFCLAARASNGAPDRLTRRRGRSTQDGGDWIRSPSRGGAHAVEVHHGCRDSEPALKHSS